MDFNKAPIKNILLIDDDCDDCEIFKVALKEVSSSLELTCSIGCEGVLQLVESCAPDLIFLDINMPKTNGFQCLSLLQESAKHCRIPIIMYSSSKTSKEVNKAYEYGAALYFKKPSRYADLVESLGSILLMDWNKPELIKQQYFREGNYHPFAL